MLDRESIRNGAVGRMVREGERHGLGAAWTDAERAASRRAVLAGRPPGSPVWVFAYGSLMWNPAFHFAERRKGLVHGYHRRFAMWSSTGRGTPEWPGLMLTLDRGGSCWGIAYRIAPGMVAEELDIIWAREMAAGSYTPAWVGVRTDTGPARAIAFTCKRDHARYTGRLADAALVERLATAEGRLGSCRDYLASTVAHLDELGVRDTGMHALLKRVRTWRAANGVEEAN